MQLRGAIRAFRAWLLLFYSPLQMFLFCFKQLDDDDDDEKMWIFCTYVEL